MPGAAGSTTDGLRVPLGALAAASLAAGGVSWPIFVWLHAQGLVTGSPLVLALMLPLIGLMATRPVQELIGSGSLVNRAALRLAVAFALFAAFCWTAGWSLVLPAAAILVAVVHIQRSGPEVWRPAILTVAATTALGQLGVALGWIETVSAPAVSHMAATSILVLSCLGILNVAASVAERDAAGAALAKADARLRALMDSSTDVLTVSDAAGALTYVSPAVQRSLGFDPQVLVGGRLLDLVDPEHRPVVSAHLAEVVGRGDGARSSMDVLVTLASGERRWHEWTVHNLLGDPSVEGLVVEQRDVTDRLLHSEALAYAASHDDLTGLPNRSDLMRRLAASLSEAGPGAGLAVLFLDLDHFKEVNDTYGHAAGDELLVVLARRLRAGLRPHDHLARISGDEFCAILTELHDVDEVRAVVGRLETLIEQPVALDDRARVEVGVSIGVALTFDPLSTPAALFAEADAAMYSTKNGRRGSSRHSARGGRRSDPHTAAG